MHVCLNCNNSFYGRYCNMCGQKYYTDKDKSVKSLFGEAFHFLTHFEGKIITTFKAILFHPGKMSLDYSRGLRQRYYKPISLFLLIVIGYLLFPVYTGLNMPLKYYKKDILYGHMYTRQIENKARIRNISDAEVDQRFHHRSQSTTKVLLFLLIPLTALILYILYPRKDRFLFDNFILATEINAFYILTVFLLLPPVLFRINYYFPLNVTESSLSIFLSILFLAYITYVLKKIFKQKWWISGLKGIGFILMHVLLFQFVYKFIVFEVTILLI